MVRRLIKQKLITRKVAETKKRITSEYRPHSVWDKKGYDVGMIVKYDVKEWNPAIGWTYAVPLKTLS